MSQVPQVNVNALYSNTTSGIPASPTAMDAAIQDIVFTINANDTAYQSYIQGRGITIDCGSFTEAPTGIVLDGGGF